MRYAGIKLNDVANGNKICVSYWAQGCPHHCKNCHNPETWNPNGGMEFTDGIIEKIIKAISANNIERDFSVLGGEPLADYNLEQTLKVIKAVRQAFPNIRIFCWTGYELENIANNDLVVDILKNIDVLIDGLFVEELKDLNLQLRGSSNQRIIDTKHFCNTGEIRKFDII